MRPDEALIAELDTARSWPIPREREYHRIVGDRRAVRRGDNQAIRRLMRWDERAGEDGAGERPLIVDPLARLIGRGFADFLFGEDPDVDMPDGIDPELFDRLDDANQLGAGFHRAERICVSEGEVWGKALVNRDVADAPLLEWRSRLEVVPLWYGGRVIAAAFVTERQRDLVDQGDDGAYEIVWRHVEVHAAGIVHNLLYQGSNTDLGERRSLESIPSTRGIQEIWRHGLPMLAWRIVNDIDDDQHLGESDLDGVRDLLFMLNEAMTIASENARLTGKDRVFAGDQFVRGDGSFPSGIEVFTAERTGGVLGDDGGSRLPIVAIEKVYDADPLWLHITRLVATILTRVGLVPQFIGEQVEGQGESGLAIRLRFLPTDNAARGKAREWDSKGPKIIDALLQVAALPVAQGGFGVAYRPTALPSFERGSVLPVDEGEQIRDEALAVDAGISSRRTAIRRLHPDWDDDQVDEELAEIARDFAPAAAAGPPPPPPGGDPEDE